MSAINGRKRKAKRADRTGAGGAGAAADKGQPKDQRNFRQVRAFVVWVWE